MPTLKQFLNPQLYIKFIRKRLETRRWRLQPNLRGVTEFPPGHYYSPLLNIEQLGPDDSDLPFDGVEMWEHINLQPVEQKAYFEDLVANFPLPQFPLHKSEDYRYFSENGWFSWNDAFTLSGIIRKEKPRRIVEVGSGFSSSVMLDTLDQYKRSAELTFIEPNPSRLDSILTPTDRSRSTILVRPVQEIPLAVFDQLEAQDVLFIDSSHVAKVGSDVTYILLRILPRLKRGVIVHFHDIFYPFSYPIHWIRLGRAWNESIVLRTFLMGNPKFQLLAFNSYARVTFPEVFCERYPDFLNNKGGSLWVRKIA